ncbi:MAG: FecR domain-containing protein [Magnetospirillum gryphiswaldense]|nr:FecR domain-containing protein [Magnetospirillum gryphiswaldense]
MPPLPDSVTPDRQALHWLLALQEHPDDDGLKARFAQWLGESPAHQQAWGALAGVDSLITTAERQRPVRPSPPWPRPLAVPALALAACLVLALLPMVQFHWRADSVTATGEVRTVTLADGSQVILAPDSAIAVSMTDTQRIVDLLRGEAFFQVRRDPDRPFTARAGDSSARVLGTAFNVRRQADSAEISVAEGSVLVSRGESSHRLVAGEWVSTAHADLADHGTVAVELVGPWRYGQLVVKDQRLADVVDILRRYQSGAILIRGDKLADRRVTGLYDLDRPADTLAALLAPLGGRVVHVTPWLTVVTD